jgi:four helix bundle protein
MDTPTTPRNYEEWEAGLADFIKQSPVWKLHVYRDALFMFDLAKANVRRLVQSKETESIVSQLYRSVGGIGANIAEGYGRNSGNERKQFFSYALGSAREADHWYHGCDHVLGDAVTLHRRPLLSTICAQLVKLIPYQHNLKEGDIPYET